MIAYLMFNLHGSELAILALALAFVALWIWTIIDCALNESSRKKKTLWLLFILLCGYIGTPAYVVRGLIRNEK